MNMTLTTGRSTATAGGFSPPLVRLQSMHFGGRESDGEIADRCAERDAVSEAVLDTLGIGIVVVDARGALVRTNRTARDLLENQHGLRARDGRLTADAIDASRRLASAVASACGRQCARSVVSIPRAGGKRPFDVFVVPLGVERDLAALFVSDPERCSAIAADLVAQAYSVTEAERRVVAALMDGKPPKRIASQLDLSLNTVKSHLRSVFMKLGVRRQVDLARLLLGAPPLGLPNAEISLPRTEG